MRLLRWTVFSLLISGMPAVLSAQQYVVPTNLFVPVGTVITVHLRDTISSDRNRTGDAFAATLQQPIVADGWVIARTGQTVIGRVASAQTAGRVRGTSELALELSELVLVDGQQLGVRTQLLANDGLPSRGNDAATVASGVGIGTVIGAVIGGGRGAVIGAAAGAGAAVAGVLSTRGGPTEASAETLLTFRLDAPIAVSTQRSEQAFLPVTAADYNTAPVLRLPDRRDVRQPRFTPSIYLPPVWSRIHVIRAPRIYVVRERHERSGRHRY